MSMNCTLALDNAAADVSRRALGEVRFAPTNVRGDWARCTQERANGPRRFVLATALVVTVLLGQMACALALFPYWSPAGSEAFWSTPSLTNVSPIGYITTNSRSFSNL